MILSTNRFRRLLSLLFILFLLLRGAVMMTTCFLKIAIKSGNMRGNTDGQGLDVVVENSLAVLFVIDRQKRGVVGDLRTDVIPLRFGIDGGRRLLEHRPERRLEPAALKVNR